MKRIYGSTNTPKVECTNRRLGKWRVRYDYTEEKDEESGMANISFLETEFLHKPTIDEIKSFVLGVENQNIDDAIVSGFRWKDIPVWLSSENQFNYKAAYDLAVQTNGSSLPVTFKFGTTENPVYYKFETIDELSNFFVSAIAYINKTLADGWARKDALDWSEYEALLNDGQQS